MSPNRLVRPRMIPPGHVFVPIADLIKPYDAPTPNPVTGVPGKPRTDWRLRVPLQKLGGVWDRERKGWYLPPGNIEAAHFFASSLAPQQPPVKQKPKPPHRVTARVTDAELAVLREIAQQIGADVPEVVRRVLSDVITKWQAARVAPAASANQSDPDLVGGQPPPARKLPRFSV